jgi:hypothetical protein
MYMLHINVMPIIVFVQQLFCWNKYVKFIITYRKCAYILLSDHHAGFAFIC